jgi:ABC-type sugar transport system ATPase subunit
MVNMQENLSDEQKQPVLVVQDVTKRFGGLVAVNAVSLTISEGEVVGLLGDNGAGKSTLIKLLSGVYRPDGGQIIFNGTPTHFTSPMDAHKHGIETIYQDLALCENLNAYQNIFLGREPVRHQFGFLPTVNNAYMFTEAQKVLEQLEIHIPNLHRPIRQLSGGQRQAVAIARAIYWNARLMIMDEPTAALGVPEQHKVLELVRLLRSRGIPVIIISHQLQDVFAVADRIIVMRRGSKVGERSAKATNDNEIVGLMIGAEK